MNYKQSRKLEMKRRQKALRAWLLATSTKHGLGLTAFEKDARRSERSRVIAKAGTSVNSLIVAASRGRIGDDLQYRLKQASVGEKNPLFADDSESKTE